MQGRIEKFQNETLLYTVKEIEIDTESVREGEGEGMIGGNCW